MPESDLGERVRDYFKPFRERRSPMTPEERAKVGIRLGVIIKEFFDEEPMSTNQEAIEIIGIAMMFYHSLLYASHLLTLEEKP